MSSNKFPISRVFFIIEFLYSFSGIPMEFQICFFPNILFALCFFSRIFNVISVFFSFHLTFEISFFHFICLVIFFSSNALFPISQKKTLFFLLPPTFLYIKRLKLTFQRYTQFNGANLILSFNKYSCLSLMKLNISPSTMQ